MSPRFTVEKLDWTDEDLGETPLPKRTMKIRSGFGSGLTTRRGDPPGAIWAIGDRGPNLKIKTAIRRYRIETLERVDAGDGAKVMPRLDLGPAIARLRVRGPNVEMIESFRISDDSGRPVSGLPVPEGGHARCEPALDLDGNLLAPDPSGLDTEGLTALADGGFWAGDEFGPSLVRLDATGRVVLRLVPQGVSLEGATYRVEARLPAIAAKRQLNRGFEALALSPDEKWLFLAFQSPLAHPDEAAHEQGRHVRLWRLGADGAPVEAQYLYPLDPPETFLRDSAKEKVEWSDLKVSEIACLGDDRLLVLERASETTKIYEVRLGPDFELPPEHLDIHTRPTVEELSGGGGGPGLPVLQKTLVFSSDETPEVAADLEGMAILSPSELLLVNDNDFGVEGALTSFWLIRFEREIFA
jgi:hypothetical protein